MVTISAGNGGLEPSRNKVVVPARQATQPGGIGSLESILGLLESLKIRALYVGLAIELFVKLRRIVFVFSTKYFLDIRYFTLLMNEQDKTN